MAALSIPDGWGVTDFLQRAGDVREMRVMSHSVIRTHVVLSHAEADGADKAEERDDGSDGAGDEEEREETGDERRSGEEVEEDEGMDSDHLSGEGGESREDT